MDFGQIAQVLFALLFTLGLIGVCALAAKRFGLTGALGQSVGTKARRLHVVESLSLDPRRRLVLIRRDGKEHLLLLGQTQDCIVEQGIEPGTDQGMGPGIEPVVAAAEAKPPAPPSPQHALAQKVVGLFGKGEERA